jgi:hypothetical protein
MTAMRNGVVHISAFAILNDIAKSNNVKPREWANKAWGDPRYASRISELRKLYKLSISGNDGEKTGRVLSADKLQALLNGLTLILGGDVMKKELIKKLDKAKSEREKNLILLMAADEQEQKSIRLYLEALLNKK